MCKSWGTQRSETLASVPTIAQHSTALPKYLASCILIRGFLSGYLAEWLWSLECLLCTHEDLYPSPSTCIKARHASPCGQPVIPKFCEKPSLKRWGERLLMVDETDDWSVHTLWEGGSSHPSLTADDTKMKWLGYNWRWFRLLLFLTDKRICCKQ